MPMRKRVQGAMCKCAVRDVLDRIADRWSLLVLLQLETETLRFSELRRRVADISQRMLSQTVRRLEMEGMVLREVIPSVPPQVRYSLTDLGRSLLIPVRSFVAWAKENQERIHKARRSFAGRANASSLRRNDDGQPKSTSRLAVAPVRG